jgi:hypothetical protein
VLQRCKSRRCGSRLESTPPLSSVQCTISTSPSWRNTLGKQHIYAAMCSVLLEASGVPQKQVTSGAPEGKLELLTQQRREARKAPLGRRGDRATGRASSHANPGLQATLWSRARTQNYACYFRDIRANRTGQAHRTNIHQCGQEDIIQPRQAAEVRSKRPHHAQPTRKHSAERAEKS